MRGNLLRILLRVAKKIQDISLVDQHNLKQQKIMKLQKQDKKKKEKRLTAEKVNHTRNKSWSGERGNVCFWTIRFPVKVYRELFGCSH